RPQAEAPATEAVSEPDARIDPRYIQTVHGKPFVVYAGLLQAARAQGLKRLEARLVSVTPDLALAEATAEFTDGAVYSQAADASPKNVNAGVAKHYPRCALTRAKARALRDALAIDMVALEELD